MRNAPCPSSCKDLLFRRIASLTVGVIAGLFLACLLLPASSQIAKDPLLSGFQNPPPEARMRMFWRIFGPSWEMAEIDYQLKIMKDAGIGGVMLFPMYPVALNDHKNGVKNDKFLSPEFLDMLGYAARKAKENGIRFSVAGGTGWPFGGPNVKVEESALRIRRMELRPEPDNTYRLPSLKTGESILAAFRTDENVTEGLKRGTFKDASTLQVYITGPTYMQVKRPAYGAEGLVVDHYNAKAAERYLDAVVAPMLKAAPNGLIQSFFCDSLEVYNSNWTLDMPEEFKKRRGYDLIPHLNELFGVAQLPVGQVIPDQRNPPITGPVEMRDMRNVRFDFWRTLAELTEERFTKTTGDWAHRHRVKLEMEAYGTPPNPLTAARYVDIPAGEQYEPRGFSFSRFAASGAHLIGKKVIGAEAWTWLGIPNRLADSLSDFKLASDYHFLAGENDLIGVDFAYSPRRLGAPGWLPYYGPVMNQNNPQWPVFPDFVKYINRCQWMLRQGKPIADVAIYLPMEDSFADGPVEQMPLDFKVRDHFVSGEVTGEFGLANAKKHRSDLIETIQKSGFNFDGIDFWSMNRLAKMRDGKLLAGDGEYRILILPTIRGMDLAALKKIAEFCRNGGTVIATRWVPDHAYGQKAFERGDQAEFRQLIGELFGERPDEAKVWQHNYGKGRAIFVPDECALLRGVLEDLTPDFRMDVGEPPYDELCFVHRRTADRDIYFISYPGEGAMHTYVGFRDWRGNKVASLWNPVTGEVHRVQLAVGPDGNTHLGLTFLTRGSWFVVLGSQPEGLQEQKETGDRPDSIALNGPWQIRFDGPNAPAPRTITNLESWTNWPDAKYFSGQATYTTDFDLPDLSNKRVLLSLRDLREVARVNVNGQYAGSAWMQPYALDFSKFVRPGKNTLEITVGNLMVNRFIGLPDEDLRPLRAVYGNRFPDPQEKRIMKEPAVSGLLGPVEVLVYK